MIVVLTTREDLHARTVQSAVRASGAVACHVVECDRIAQRQAITYGVNHALGDGLLTADGERIALSEATVLWLRRMPPEQSLPSPLDEEHAAAVINADCRGALLGYLATHFRGKWISTPEATTRAANKLLQLQAAHECGFRVPRTLVSQSRDDVLGFFEACERQIVVKTVVGAPGPLLETVRIEDPARLGASAFAASPAIYQELIPGTEHLRLNCFGDASYAGLIRSDNLDWRGNLAVPISAYRVESDLHDRVRAVLDRLGLEMGIVDIKLTPDGEPVWLEVNPQGQFLFLDAFTDLRLAEHFAEYLLDEARGMRPRTLGRLRAV